MFALFCMYLEDQLPAGFPTIDMGPQLKVVERSRTATMLCAASGNPDPEISWFKDFLPVNTSSNNGRIKQLRSGKQNFDHFFIFLFPNSSFFFLTPFLIPISNLLLLQTMILILLIFNPCFLAADSPSCVVASCDILTDFVCCCCCDTSWLCMIPNPSILYQTFWNRLPTVLQTDDFLYKSPSLSILLLSTLVWDISDMHYMSVVKVQVIISKFTYTKYRWWWHVHQEVSTS